MLAGKVTEQNLGKDFETLLGMLRPEESVNKEDIRIIKEQIFGPNVFWVTGTRATDDLLEGGIVVNCFFTMPAAYAKDMLYLLLATSRLNTVADNSEPKQNSVYQLSCSNTWLHLSAIQLLDGSMCANLIQGHCAR